MLKNISHEAALEFMLQTAKPVLKEKIDINNAFGRVLAEDIRAEINIPPFDRSPYDGYAFRSEDVIGVSPDNPVELKIIAEIPAGTCFQGEIITGTAAKILTGAPVPAGANAVVKYEETEFCEETVKIFKPVARPDIVLADEYIRKGNLLAYCGDLLEPALVGAFAAQGIASVNVYKVPRVGIISTGSELVEPGEEISFGKIQNSNRYILEGALRLAGVESMDIGTADDTPETIAELIQAGLDKCDAVISTGGVSVGDYDMTPAAMELAGVELLIQRLSIRPGGACAYGQKGGKLFFALSGNPAAAMINYYTIALPCLRKILWYAKVPQ